MAPITLFGLGRCAERHGARFGGTETNNILTRARGQFFKLEFCSVYERDGIMNIELVDIAI